MNILGKSEIIRKYANYFQYRDDFKDAFDKKELDEASDSWDLKPLFNLIELRNAGFSVYDLEDALGDLKKSGFSAKDLKEAGFRIFQLKNAGFSPKDLKEAGFSNKYIFPPSVT